jgi:hypothetical protein
MWLFFLMTKIGGMDKGELMGSGGNEMWAFFSLLFLFHCIADIIFLWPLLLPRGLRWLFRTLGID